jgi:glycerol-3-phosphate dehydrogenase subunit B
MEVADTRVELAKRINEVVTDEQYIALPAMLGIHRPDLIHKDLEKHLGLPVFEIPTMPPAVPGIRLREMMEQQLSLRGAAVVSRHQVNQVTLDSDTIKLQVHDNYAPIVVEADYLLLASGRFLSGGLKTDRRSIHESLLGLPVKQPHNREQWFSEAYFDRKGHPVNRSGVMVNDQFQVVDEQGVVIDDRLYAAGILLADQDWIRQRSGVGIALASAYKAICSLQQRL